MKVDSIIFFFFATHTFNQMNWLSIVLIFQITIISESKIIELPNPIQTKKEIKQQGKIKYYFEDSTNEYLTYRIFPSESSFITSNYYTKKSTNDSLIHIIDTNLTYIYSPSLREQEEAPLLQELKFESFNYIEEIIPISGCMRKQNSTASISLIQSFGIGILIFPNDLFIGGDFYILAANLDWGNNGLSLNGYNSLRVTCRSDLNGIIQIFKKIKMIKIQSKIRKINIDKKFKKFKILNNWKQIIGNFKRKEMGMLVFDLNLHQEMPYCESRKDYLQCNVLE